MQRCLVMTGSVLAACVFAVYAPLLWAHPGVFVADTAMLLACVGISFGGGLLDGRGPAIPFGLQADRLHAALRAARLFLAACGGVLATALVAAVMMPPDPFTMLQCFLPLSLCLGVFYAIGFRKSRSQGRANVEVSFARPLQYSLVLLMGLVAFLTTAFLSDDSIAWRTTGAVFLISSGTVLFAFRPRWSRTRSTKSDAAQLL